jgi:hypothetical protein
VYGPRFEQISSETLICSVTDASDESSASIFRIGEYAKIQTFKRSDLKLAGSTARPGSEELGITWAGGSSNF